MQVEWITEAPQLLGNVGQLSQSDVLGLQVQMNIDNRCIGSPRAGIEEDGIAGSETCAMAEFLNGKTGTPWDGSLCPGGGPVSAYPAAELCAMASKPAPPGPSTPPPGEEPPPAAAAASNGTSPWVWAALGVAVVVGGVLYMKGGV